ncbi:MAG TPA: hypothetical protein VGA99_05565 [bacterium]
MIPNKIAEIYSELLIRSLDPTSPDSLPVFEALLRQHGLTTEQFESQLAKYEQHPEIWHSIVEQTLQALRADSTKPGDTPPQIVSPKK